MVLLLAKADIDVQGESLFLYENESRFHITHMMSKVTKQIQHNLQRHTYLFRNLQYQLKCHTVYQLYSEIVIFLEYERVCHHRMLQCTRTNSTNQKVYNLQDIRNSYKAGVLLVKGMFHK